CFAGTRTQTSFALCDRPQRGKCGLRLGRIRAALQNAWRAARDQNSRYFRALEQTRQQTAISRASPAGVELPCARARSPLSRQTEDMVRGERAAARGIRTRPRKAERSL